MKLKMTLEALEDLLGLGQQGIKINPSIEIDAQTHAIVFDLKLPIELDASEIALTYHTRLAPLPKVRVVK